MVPKLLELFHVKRNVVFKPTRAGNVYDIALKYRKRLLANEKTAVLEVDKAWRAAYGKLRTTHAQLELQLAATGNDPAKLHATLAIQARIDQVESIVSEYTARVEEITKKHQRENIGLALERVTETLQSRMVSAGFNLVPREALETMVGFLQDGTPLSELMRDVSRDALKAAKKELVEGLAAGENPRKVARRIFLGSNKIGEPVILPAERALRIARTETLRSYRVATIENYRANASIIKGWRWLCARGPRTCIACIAMDGTEHDLSEMMSSHVCCRCTEVPILIFGDEPQSPIEDWLRGRTQEENLKSFGSRARLEAWRSGGVPLSAMATKTTDPKWGDGVKITPLYKLRERYPNASFSRFSQREHDGCGCSRK